MPCGVSDFNLNIQLSSRPSMNLVLLSKLSGFSMRSIRVNLARFSKSCSGSWKCFADGDGSFPLTS